MNHASYNVMMRHSATYQNRIQQSYKHEMETELQILYYMILKVQHFVFGSDLTNLQQKKITE